MKKHLAFLALLAGMALNGSNSAWENKLTEFMKMLKEHKLEWFDFIKDTKDEKLEMLKKHKSDWFDARIATIKQWQRIDVSEQPAKDSLFQQELGIALAIRKRHMKDWEEFCKDMQEKAKKIHTKQKEKLEELEKGLK